MATRKRTSPADTANPSAYAADYWLWAERQQGAYAEPTEYSGKWMVFPSVEHVDRWWAIIKRATEKRDLVGRRKWQRLA